MGTSTRERYCSLVQRRDDAAISSTLLSYIASKHNFAGGISCAVRLQVTERSDEEMSNLVRYVVFINAMVSEGERGSKGS
jgi:hypothetical protein